MSQATDGKGKLMMAISVIAIILALVAIGYFWKEGDDPAGQMLKVEDLPQENIYKGPPQQGDPPSQLRRPRVGTPNSTQ